MDDARIYDQDCQFYRYQDKLRWNRFQTVAAIEAAMLVAAQSADIGAWEKVAFFAFASVLVVMVTCIARRDESRADIHKQRLRAYEEQSNSSAKQSNPFKDDAKLTGAKLMRWASCLIILFNIAVLAYLIRIALDVVKVVN